MYVTNQLRIPADKVTEIKYSPLYGLKSQNLIHIYIYLYIYILKKIT
jgi:hypothetical protein